MAEVTSVSNNVPVKADALVVPRQGEKKPITIDFSEPEELDFDPNDTPDPKFQKQLEAANAAALAEVAAQGKAAREADARYEAQREADYLKELKDQEEFAEYAKHLEPVDVTKEDSIDGDIARFRDKVINKIKSWLK